jgi:hypothetical protein
MTPSIIEDLEMDSDLISDFPSIPSQPLDDFDLWFQNRPTIVPSSLPCRPPSIEDLAFMDSLDIVYRRSLFHQNCFLYRPSRRRHFKISYSDSLRRVALFNRAMTVADYAIQWVPISDDILSMTEDTLQFWENLFWRSLPLRCQRRALRQDIVAQSFDFRVRRWEVGLRRLLYGGVLWWLDWSDSDWNLGSQSPFRCQV